jgi:hypothetical protein
MPDEQPEDEERTQEPESTDSAHDLTAPIQDPFDRRRQLPQGLIFVDDDLDDPGGFVAWRIGNADLRGYGKTQIEAIRHMEQLEAIRPPPG